MTDIQSSQQLNAAATAAKSQAKADSVADATIACHSHPKELVLNDKKDEDAALVGEPSESRDATARQERPDEPTPNLPSPPLLTSSVVVGGGCAEGQRTLHPFVHWAQSQTHITLRIDLIQVENLNVHVDDDCLGFKFSARGKGAHGLQEYSFALDFLSEVDRKFDCHKIERYVLILIKKLQPFNWPRLTKLSAKLPWLRIDFDRYAGDDSDASGGAGGDVNDDNDSDSEFCSSSSIKSSRDKQAHELNHKLLEEAKRKKQGEKRGTNPNSWASSLDNIFKNKNKDNFDIFNPFKRQQNFKGRNTSAGEKMKYDHRKDGGGVATTSSKNTAKSALDFKKTYLFLYNVVMFIMFLKVYIVLIIKGLSGTIDDDTVQGAAFIIKILTYTQLLETVHPMLGLVPGGPMMPFVQTLGRLIVNYFLADPTIRMDSFPNAHYLFLVWTSIEIFRYSFYALRVFKVNIYALTWCRYTLFLPLYPMGGFFESMVLFSTIKQYEKTGAYSVGLPNPANMSFSLPFVLRVYIFLLLGPTIYSLMKYMWRQRSKQLKEKIA